MNMATKSPVLLLGAMDGEVQGIFDAMEGAEFEDWNGHRFASGRLSGIAVVAAKTGVGKSLSAMVAQHAIDRWQPRAIIVTGLAGALNPVYDLGDTVLANDCLQHDMDATALGFARGAVPYTPYRLLSCDETLCGIAATWLPPHGRLHRGRILTGDVFVSRRRAGEMPWLIAELGGDAVEMEGASVGLVATVNRIPFVLLRTISDKADSGAKVNFTEFLPKASRLSLSAVQHILDKLAKEIN